MMKKIALISSNEQSPIQSAIIELSNKRKVHFELISNLCDADIIIVENWEVFLSSLDQIKESSILIINSDYPIEWPQNYNKKVCVITYGLNAKSTVTASSITEEGFTCCIQRNIETKSKKIICPQEFQVKNFQSDIYAMLAALSAFMVCFDEIIF